MTKKKHVVVVCLYTNAKTIPTVWTLATCLSSWDRLTVIFMTFLKQRCIKTIGFQSAQHLLADLLFLSICLLVVMKSLFFKVDLETSVVDPELKQMTIRYKHGGVIEELLG